MKIIEIQTTQNVVLQYELADLKDRILAFLIDISTVTFALGILAMIFASVFSGPTQELLSALLLVVFIFYSFAFEVMNNGQSPGKMAMRIQVIKSGNGRPSVSDYAARWVFRLVDVYFSFGAVASVMITSSPKSQRIGDIVANTAVIKLTPTMGMSLSDLLSLHATRDYKPSFPEARQLYEEDAILIKNTLERYRRFGNSAHTDVLNKLAKEVAEVLRVDIPSNDNRKFLEMVLRDYVMLTR